MALPLCLPVLGKAELWAEAPGTAWAVARGGFMSL